MTSADLKQERASFREMLAVPAAPTMLAALLLFSLSALIVPFADHAYLAVGYCVLAAFFYYFFARALMPVVGVALPAFLLYSLLGTPTAAVAFVAVVLGGGAGALVLTFRHDLRRDWPLCFIPPLLYGAAAFITGDAARGLLTLLPLAVAVVMAVCLWRFAGQTTAVIATAVTLAASLVAAWLLTLAVTGALHGNVLVRFADALRAAVVTAFAEARALYAEAGLSLAITDEAIENTAASLVNALPGLFGVICTVSAFLAWRTFVRLLLGAGVFPRPPMRIVTLQTSVTCAILFSAAYLASLIANAENTTAVGVVLRNFALLLEPGLALVGFASLAGRGARSCLSLLLAIGLVLLLFNSPGVGFALAAFCGAFHVIAARFFPPSDSKGDQ